MQGQSAKPAPVYKEAPFFKRLAIDFQKHKYKYLLILPIIVYLILFCYSLSTAVGLFNTMVNVVFLLITNYISKKSTESGLF